MFDGLLPEPHNRVVMKLLFTFGYWHGLAKLRLQIDETLDLLDGETCTIGKELRAFINKTCAQFDTRELRRESEARKRRGKKKADSRVSDGTSSQCPSSAEPEHTSEKESVPKKLNINTFKAHSLGDYSRTIRRLGTTDSYSTVIVSDAYHNVLPVASRA